MMDFELSKAIEVLARTPKVLIQMLDGLSDNWTQANEGKNSWSPFDIVGHLIHGELTDWILRTQIILQKREHPVFTAFDRFAQEKTSVGKSLSDTLNEFRELRAQNIQALKSFNINEEQLDWKGIHPEFGEVTLRQLLATWVAHDLGHLSQISRVMARQYKSEVGPWQQYLSILNH